MDLENIHWRQFEFLAGEWFRSQGYETTIIPPSGDGGMDVRAARRGSIIGPELVIVQAKRLSGGNHVGIDTVKVLWTDVNDSTATQGLIATTTVLERGAREFCEARKYRLFTAERGTVEQWLSQLATYPR
jgi:HJR/Mrr/RecB family endonuclease